VLRSENTWPATPEHVGDARHSVAAFAARAGARRPVLDGVRLAVSEAVANAVVHGYRGTGDGCFTVIAEADDDGHLIVTVTDHGQGLSPRHDSPGAGLGLPLISEVADLVRLAPAENGRGTVVSMKFELPVPAPA
jgi:stage II sporulation protein AB (anti-sigma F factor)